MTHEVQLRLLSDLRLIRYKPVQSRSENQQRTLEPCRKMTLKPRAFVLFNVGQQPESTTECDNTSES